ncbi:iron-sulfur cluster biosynthesis family protein [Clostridium ihumii]|uniref:iron-sulfur cluster biosynthesis family protein n=1 Tax=Clostridium ihumii TaxID=1470356 RepID=UPI000590A0C9|nr:iron-sulfur cluster biosynthesis family protein [Clostridium ihumii]
MIINITDSAKLVLNKLCRQDSINEKTFRVYLKEIACSGAIFYITLDKATKDDLVFDVDDFKIIISKELCSKFTVVNIYYNTSDSFEDFKITTDLVWKDEYHYTGL